MKKLIIGLAIVVVLVIFGVLFYTFMYKGSLTVTPQTKGIKMEVRGKVYSSFPTTLKLFPGNHIVKYYKDGYLSQSESITILPFKIMSSQPSLREVYLVNYISKQNFNGPVFSPEGQYIYYYDPGQKLFMRLPAYYTKKKIDNVFAESISPAINFNTNANSLKVIWSPLRTKAALVAGGKALIYDLNTKKEYPIENVNAVSFIDDSQMYYVGQNGILFRSNFDGTATSSLTDLNGNYVGAELSPNRNFLAIYGNKLIVLDLTKQRTIKEIDKEINILGWGTDNLLAYGRAVDSDSELYLLDINSTETGKDLGLINEKAFTWRGSDLIYMSKINYHPKVVNLSTEYNIKNTLFVPNMIDQPNLLLTNSNKLIFSSLSGRGKLLAITVD